MSLPVINSVTRKLPRDEFIKRLRSNLKTSKYEGISNLNKPEWLKIRPPTRTFHELKQHLSSVGVVTVCQESHCPNMAECWSGGTATFMVMGDTCTRTCRFCAVKARGRPAPLDPQEPGKLVRAVSKMNLDYVVVTSVDRDDLPDGGAKHFADCITALKNSYPELLVEVLIGDFQGDLSALRVVVSAKPTVIAHNLETVRRLTPDVRDRRASYDQSLKVLSAVKKLDSSIHTKSSLMVGLGESMQELCSAMDDLRAAGVDIVTFGQYLQPSSWHLPVTKYYHPDEFEELRKIALKKGFRYCASGPFVRSSYKAAELFVKSCQ